MSDEKLAQQNADDLLDTLKIRFETNEHRHIGIAWQEVEDKLVDNPEKLWTLNEMEQTEGEPDVVGQENDSFIFMDCSKESPKGRRSLCYDHAALESRKKHKPESAAITIAEKMGIEMLTEEDYRYLQTHDSFDKKTSSWIKTPDNIRSLGGALFCDYRYDTVFTYHNGAESYYASRGFRGKLNI